MDAPSVNLIDYFNLDFNASLASLSQDIVIVPVVLDHYAYLNRIKGYNPSGYTETITVGYIDSQNAYVPFSITAATTATAFNVQLDTVVTPQMGAYWSAISGTYPATVQLMVDGYLFDLC